MITSSRILIATIVAFVVMAAGFSVGIHFHQKRKMSQTAPPMSAEVSDETNASEEPPPIVNNNTYEISPPSMGLMLETYPVNITTVQGDVGHTEVPGRDAARIQFGQKVFLYNQNGGLLNSLGEVVSILPSSEGTGDFSVVEINLQNNPDVYPAAVAKGRIIVERVQNANRLPYAALTRNEKGGTFVWEVSGNPDTGQHIVKLKPIDILASNDLIFTLRINHTDSNQFILNPDANLRDGQQVNVRKFLYTPPSQYEEERIVSVVQRRVQQLADQKERERLLSQMGNPTSSSCAQPASAAQDFINKVKLLAEKRPPSSTSP